MPSASTAVISRVVKSSIIQIRQDERNDCCCYTSPELWNPSSSYLKPLSSVLTSNKPLNSQICYSNWTSWIVFQVSPTPHSPLSCFNAQLFSQRLWRLVLADWWAACVTLMELEFVSCHRSAVSIRLFTKGILWYFGKSRWEYQYRPHICPLHVKLQPAAG